MDVLRIHRKDSVAIALTNLPEGREVGDGVVVGAPIPAGHKLAVRAIPAGAPVLKFAQPIGIASQAIAPGDHVHSHNLEFRPGLAEALGAGAVLSAEPVARSAHAQFRGIVRADGRVATRNYIGILTTVNCSATAARLIADRFRGDVLGAWPNVDGVVALTHQTGCGMGSSGEAMDVLRRTLAGYATHPNFAGVLLLGLGCEANQMEALVATTGLQRSEALCSIVIQDAGGTAATVRAGVEAVTRMLDPANRVARQPLPASHLKLGLQCGGSDGFSGLTANPALGAAVDLLVGHGGTAVLSETPEIYGAEHLLLARAVDPAVAARLRDRLTWWQAYAARTGETLDNNPSPGNKAGGLTTILEKSLGAVAKGGTTALMDVIGYAEPVRSPGLVFMDTPGYDPVSATGQVAGGCTLIAFTTGRGSCFGCVPAPSLKLATNSALFRRMPEDMDLNCGEILDGTASVAAMGEQIFARLLAVASGERTASETLGYGAAEFAPWVLGATV
ncbi:MAG: altronate dehydratase [Azospirillum sp.]|nr:altronate dehydratase [Azospirillum sp.]